MIRLGIVADDITGAGDIAGMTATAGYLTEITTLEALQYVEGSRAEVVVIDTDSRFDTPEIAYQKVAIATKYLLNAGCQQFFNKTCSVFRGNVGAEFDAMRTVLHESFAIVVLGFPQNGRITRKGIHYVHGQKLEASAFRSDPIHPTTKSSLVDILRAQTLHPVRLLSHEVIAQGSEELGKVIDRAQQDENYLILDVVDDEALNVIARAVGKVRMLGGSSALAKPLAAGWSPPQLNVPPKLPKDNGQGVLCLAGSLTPQTRGQIDYLKLKDKVTLRLEPERLLDFNLREHTIQTLVSKAGKQLSSGADVLIHTVHKPENVRKFQSLGVEFGYSPSALGRLVSGALADIVQKLSRTIKLNRLVIAGGDTSATICRRLNIHRMTVYKEIKPGIPSLLSMQENGRDTILMVLKSGSFGDKLFLLDAIEHVKEGAATRR